MWVEYCLISGATETLNTETNRNPRTHGFEDIMMRRLLGIACTGLIAITPLSSHASLFDRGNGLIYDDALNITWMQDANYAGTDMTWDSAMSWASDLSYGGFDDWRLPTTSIWGGADTTCGANLAGPGYKDSPQTAWQFDTYVGCRGNAGQGYNEMGQLYFETLGNPDDATYPASQNFQNTGPFENIQYAYWLDYLVSSNRGLLHYVEDGRQTHLGTGNPRFAWAVRDGDVSVVPLPAAAWLLLSGLAGLTTLARGRRRV